MRQSHYRDGDIAEAHLWQAKAAAPDHPAVLIGLYRFYFYKNRLVEALSMARACLEKAARDNGLAPDWREAALRTRLSQTSEPFFRASIFSRSRATPI